jgi:hypothetical protein
VQQRDIFRLKAASNARPGCDRQDVRDDPCGVTVTVRLKPDTTTDLG